MLLMKKLRPMEGAKGKPENSSKVTKEAEKMGLLSIDLLITLQILPVFFSNCLFLALYDSVILLKHVVLLLSRSKSTRGEWRRMLTSEGLRCVWKSFLLDAYKQVSQDQPYFFPLGQKLWDRTFGLSWGWLCGLWSSLWLHGREKRGVLYLIVKHAFFSFKSLGLTWTRPTQWQ
uniref:Iodothyronine deiodinase n=1 Tax=Monodelphis domestica TaxID=13616 RepID=A0A5F8HCC0_MONDO